MARLGVRFDFSPQFTHQDVLDLVLLAEERGYETVWVPEGGGLDSLTQLSAFATATSRIRLGTGVLPVFSRTATLVAMSAAGLDIISNHRFILGLGVGHRGAVEAYHGIPFRRPITRLRETVEVVRRLLNGERLEYEGQIFNVRDASLGLPQGLQVPIYIAALGSRVVELAGEVADGVLLNWAAPAYLEQTLAHLQQGAARAGRRREDVDAACYIRVAVTEEPEAARGPLRQQILRYLGMEYYRNYFEQTGFQEEVRAISRLSGQRRYPEGPFCD